MGTKIVISNADFSSSGMAEPKYRVNLVQGGVNVVFGNANFGSIVTPAGTTRLRAPSTTPVYVAKGDSVIFAGLKSIDGTKTLLIDGIRYTQATISHEYAVDSLNGNSPTNFFTHNSEKEDVYVWKNDIADGYFEFVFGTNSASATSDDIAPSDFELYASVQL